MVTVVEFDFATKQERTIPLGAMSRAFDEGRFCWIDADLATGRDEVAALLVGLGVHPNVIDAAVAPEGEDRHDAYDELLHLGVTEVLFDAGRFATAHVDLVLSDRFLVTLRRGEVEFMEQVRRTYRRDFLMFARGPGFLLYEFWDHLIDGYRKAERRLGDHVEGVQGRIFGDADDAIFAHVADITRDLLAFRKIILTAREVLNELSTRRSPVVPETTQPFLEKMVGTLDRLGADIAVEREILAETLHLYLGIVSHRTNKILTRLTTVSLVFLPLTFLCGVYGMNFESIPELKWRYGYIFFWSAAALVISTMLVYIRRWGLW